MPMAPTAGQQAEARAYTHISEDEPGNGLQVIQPGTVCLVQTSCQEDCGGMWFTQGTHAQKLRSSDTAHHGLLAHASAARAPLARAPAPTCLRTHSCSW